MARKTAQKFPEVTYSVACEPEDIPVRGNAMASGDSEADREAEDSIIADLESGNDWAWCYVKVTATIEIDGQTFTGTDGLGCCSYKSEEDFRQPGGYFEDMCSQALADLKVSLEDAIKRGEIARKALNAVK